MSLKLQFSIDRGGTFTDIYCIVPSNRNYNILSNEIITLKLLSIDPAYKDAPTEGIRRILERLQVRGVIEKSYDYNINNSVDTYHIESIRMGTTVATNSLLEHNGAKFYLLITKGFKDLLYIGNQSRPNIFDLDIKRLKPIYGENVLEVDERIVLDKYIPSTLYKDCEIKVSTTGEKIRILKSLDIEQITLDLQKIYNSGIRSIAILLMHSYLYSEHEEIIEDIAKRIGFTQISLSSKLMPMVKLVSRGYTTILDAYLTPCIQQYINTFKNGFDDNLLKNVKVEFMQSDGGLATISNFSGYRAIISGPAGGVVGYAQSTYDPVSKMPLIGFDMGGTSTDVSRYAGEYEYVFETSIAGCTIMAPQLDVNTVAAGGGSMLFFRSGLFVVGPESASAHPGPACYKKNGPLTITDANLLLGRLIPRYFPHIFGTTQDQPLDYEATLCSFKALQISINKYLSGNNKPTMSIEQIASGFIDVANESMCRPIRALTQGKGYDITSHCLSVFGGAGGQHACAIAKSLGIRKVIIHKYAGILSAYGMSLADVNAEEQVPCHKIFTLNNLAEFKNQFERLKLVVEKQLTDQGFGSSKIDYEYYLNMRYNGTDNTLMITSTNGSNFDEIFISKYSKEYGFKLDRDILVDDIRVRGIARNDLIKTLNEIDKSADSPKPPDFTHCYFDTAGWIDKVPVYQLHDLLATQRISGPAIIMNSNATILIEPDCTAEITIHGNLLIEIPMRLTDILSIEHESPIHLAIFSHRFMSIAEQMGRTLQRTAISTNIKERLDFSCALFGPNGDLVANAPHLPVHLGSMQEAVKYQIRTLDKWEPNMVILSNHPVAGGSHLPDITVITPVFDDSSDKPVFFVASRGHHADIGGITPGSMPPFSKSLDEEGAAILSFKLVSKGLFDEKGITEILSKRDHGFVGTRNLSDNLSDLKAQVAANIKGIQLMNELISQYTLPIVQAYMRFIQSNAELAVRDMLRAISLDRGLDAVGTIKAVDYLDDGTPICLSITIDRVKDGTGTQVYANLNAPKSVTYSAIIYCLRCLVKQDIPLNQGCLLPISIIIPDGSILSPSPNAAVVGGNVLTSQRVTDVILKAFEACAASCGCMNNFTCGDESFGYYETICGGSGAGPSWNGISGVHTHMTNTRITDPEIVERRYPMLVREFSLRDNSGGIGKYNGGDGVIREFEFLTPLSLGILSERRAFRPYGMHGGNDAQPGLNYIIRKSDSITLNLGPKNTYNALSGDKFRILTPGGGGYGRLEDKTSVSQSNSLKSHHDAPHGSLSAYKSLQEQV